MTFIFDMPNGGIQSETTMETGTPDQTPDTMPVAELRLAMHEVRETHRNGNEPQVNIHLIRRLLSSG